MNKTNEQNKERQKEAPKGRQIILETDGNRIKIVKAEVAGNIELIAILETLSDFLKKQQ